MSNEPILSGLQGKNILITGCTGFVGKVVLEKLMRSAPTWNKIFLLIRPNNEHATAKKRFQHGILKSSLFEKLGSEIPEQFDIMSNNALHVVSGEITQPMLGLDASEFERLGKQVDVIINVAASVDFREPLDKALDINTFSVKHIAELATLNNAAVIHVSTCYVNGYNGGLIREEVAPPARGKLPRINTQHYDLSALITRLLSRVQRAEALHKQDAARKQALINIGLEEARRMGWNDTYTFTKWLGEQMLLQALPEQSVTIVRPSIIESTLASPVPGWIEGVKVADAIILAYAREKISLFPGNKNAVIDIIPADLVANSIILSAVEALTKMPAHRIYQCSSSHTNPLRLKEMIGHVHAEAQENHEHHQNLFLRRPQKPFHMVPGLVFDGVMQGSHIFIKARNSILDRLGIATSNKPLKNIETAKNLSSVFSFYTHPFYRFSNEKLCALAQELGVDASSEFAVDAAIYDWSHYLPKVHIAGLNKYALQPRTARLPKKSPRRVTEAA